MAASGVGGSTLNNSGTPPGPRRPAPPPPRPPPRPHKPLMARTEQPCLPSRLNGQGRAKFVGVPGGVRTGSGITRRVPLALAAVLSRLETAGDILVDLAEAGQRLLFREGPPPIVVHFAVADDLAAQHFLHDLADFQLVSQAARLRPPLVGREPIDLYPRAVRAVHDPPRPSSVDGNGVRLVGRPEEVDDDVTAGDRAVVAGDVARSV